MRQITSPLDGFASPFGARRFSPASLFVGGSVGAWFEAPRIATLSQDTLGATPVTAPTQTVGRAGDLSGNGLNATQATAGARPTYSVVPAGGRRNRVTYSEQFDNAVWQKVRASISPNAAVAPDGATTADKLVEDGTAGNSHFVQGSTGVLISSAAAGTYTASVYIKAAERGFAAIRITVDTSTLASIVVNLSTGAITATSGTNDGTSVADVGNGWWRVAISKAHTTGNVNIGIAPSDVASPGFGVGLPAYDGDGVSGILIWGAQLELASAVTAYQKVVTALEITEAGVKSVAYLFDDGGDSISWTAPAGNYTVARVNSAATVTIQTAQALSGATDMLLDAQQVAYVAVNRDLNEGETANLTAYLTRLAS